MDYTNYPPRPRINRFESTAMTLGIASVISCTMLYVSIPCGALAILFANLSRGAKMEYSKPAKIGKIAGIIGLVLTVVIFTAAFAYALQEFGSIEGIVRNYCDMMGLDFEELYGELFQ